MRGAFISLKPAIIYLLRTDSFPLGTAGGSLGSQQLFKFSEKKRLSEWKQNFSELCLVVAVCLRSN